MSILHESASGGPRGVVLSTLWDERDDCAVSGMQQRSRAGVALLRRLRARCECVADEVASRVAVAGWSIPPGGAEPRELRLHRSASSDLSNPHAR